MSLYNMIFGYNPFAGMLLQLLDISQSKIPRFRDCYLNEEGDEIILYTRTGGGNRDFYEDEQTCRDNYPEDFNGERDPIGPWNSDLRNIDGFIRDADADSDSTYATFHYTVPEAAKPMVDLIKVLGACGDPKQAWSDMLRDLNAGDTSKPAVQRAIKVGEQISEQIKNAFPKDD